MSSAGFLCVRMGGWVFGVVGVGGRGEAGGTLMKQRAKPDKNITL